LYASRSCTDQLRAIHKVSVEEMSQSENGDVVVVKVKVRNAEGRTDIASGAVTIGNLKGDNLANALMKAETKAKRRATLSICGLGFLDETEIETIPEAAKKATAPPRQPAKILKIAEAKKPAWEKPRTIEVDEKDPNWLEFGTKLVGYVRACKTLDEVQEWKKMNEASLTRMADKCAEIFDRLHIAMNKVEVALVPSEKGE
jgi:hypothetical protein